jgi:hypothetical protein
MTAFSRGGGRLRPFFLPFGFLLRLFAGGGWRRKAASDIHDIPDSLKRDIGLLEARGCGRGRSAAFRSETRRAAMERDRNWQRHLDRPLFPPV